MPYLDIDFTKGQGKHGNAAKEWVRKLFHTNGKQFPSDVGAFIQCQSKLGRIRMAIASSLKLSISSSP